MSEAVVKFSVSFDSELGYAVRHAAEQAKQPLSGWLAEAAAAKLRAEALDEFITSWEAEHGAITAEELQAAAERLQLPILEVDNLTYQAEAKAAKVEAKKPVVAEVPSTRDVAAGAGGAKKVSRDTMRPFKAQAGRGKKASPKTGALATTQSAT